MPWTTHGLSIQSCTIMKIFAYVLERSGGGVGNTKEGRAMWDKLVEFFQFRHVAF